MATSRPFAYNPSGTPISGTLQVGSVSVGVDPTINYSANPGGIQWWNGPDEELGYVIAKPVPNGDQHTPVAGLSASISFLRTSDFTDQSFVNLVSSYFGQDSANGPDAKKWLNDNGYWTSYLAPVLSLDAGIDQSYPGSGTVWTDLVGGKTFNLFNNPVYSSENGGKINFQALSGQYAETNEYLPDLSAWSISVWHFYKGGNVGNGMCIVTEVYPGSTGNINFSLGDNDNGGLLSAGFFDGGWRTTNGYSLVANNWYHIVGTYDGNNINLYVNNNLVSSQLYSGSSISSQGGIRLMRRWDNPDFWDGGLAIVDIFDNALNSSQVSSLWNLNKDRFGLGNITFTVTSSDFANAFGAYGVTNNGTLGFVNSAPSNIVDNFYGMTNPQGSISTTITNAFTAAGMSTNHTGYLWNVTWGPGSTNSTLVRMSWNSSNGELFMSPINPSDSGYLSGNSSQSLAGTFNLPATFTAVQPALVIANNYWC